MMQRIQQKKLFVIGWIALLCPLSIVLALMIFGRTSWVKDKSQIGGYSEAMDIVDYGRNYMRQGDFQMALFHFNAALEIQPGIAETYMALGNLYHRIKNNNAAISSFQKAISLSPPKKEVIYNDLGMIYVELGDFQSATKNFRKAATLGIRQALIWRNIAMAEMELDNYDKAIYACQQAIKNRPTLKNQCTEMLKEKLAEDLNDDCHQIVERLLSQEIDEKFLSTYDDKVVQYWMRREPFLFEDILCLARAYEENGQIDKAIDNYRRVTKMQQNRSSIYNRLGLLLAKQGRFDEAELIFVEALNVNPDNQGAQKALKKLRTTGSY